MGCACWPHPAGVDHSRDECDEEYGLIQQMLATMVWSAFAVLASPMLAPLSHRLFWLAAAPQ
eukprot:142332-Pelagomonas_calceolata.AAC.1